MKHKALIILAFLSILGNVILGIYILSNTDSNPGIESNKYKYLSSQIFSQNTNDILINFVGLRNTLNSLAKSSKSTIGVYFEYLPTGMSIGVNEKQPFIIASLGKVPIVMAAYKEVERGKIKLDDKIKLEERDIDLGFGEFGKNPVGTQVTIEQVIDLALTKSDNTAKNILDRIIPNESLVNVFESLDIPNELDSNAAAVISPKNYSSILKSLYLSSYLNFENSNKILELLTKTEFKDILPAGIPSQIEVAHKIGVHDIDQDKIYTDCGIVYIPRRPYTLCLMSKSKDEKKAKEIMEKISKSVYEYLINVNYAN